jgi:hypothetical protein
MYRQMADVAIDRHHLVAALGEEQGMAAAAGGEVQHGRLRLDQAGPLDDPGQWRPSCIISHETPSFLALPFLECQRPELLTFS